MLEIIRPILAKTYGDTEWVDALAAYLVSRLEAGPSTWTGYSREDTIRNICWDWMTGGDTAAYVAAKIEGALKGAGL